MLNTLRTWTSSLEGKFILAATACILVFSLSAGLFIVHREEQLHRTDAYHRGSTLTEISRLMLTNVMLNHELGMMDRQDLQDYLDFFIVNLKDRDSSVRSVMVVDKDGTVLAHSDMTEFGRHYDDGSLQDAFALLKPNVMEKEHKGERSLLITAPLNIDTKKWGALRIALSLEEMYADIRKLQQEILLISVGILILALGVLKIAARKLSSPIVQLTQMMDSIRSHGDLQIVPDPARRRDELGKLQSSFFWLLQRLAEADRERKRAIEQLAQNEKLVSIGYLASGVAHEINNPLGGITICFKNLANLTPQTPEAGTLTMAIEDGLKKIKVIVEQLLDFSRASKTEKKPLNLNSLICRLLVLFQYEAQKREIRIDLDLDEDVPICVADENKIAQVFMNLITNALQAMGGGGILHISTGQDDNGCRIAFSDTGEGISPENVPYIFDPFFSTKKIGEGTGLGLSVSRGIIEQHQGSLQVDSEPGRGTTFTIRIP